MAELDVALYLRKARATGNFSIEAIFGEVAARLRTELRIALVEAPRLSNGLLPRLAIAWHARGVVARILHVTGDIHFAALLAPRRRLVLTIHDVGFLHRPDGLARRLLKALWLDWPARRARVVTTVSQAMADEIRRETGAPLAQLRVVPNAVPADVLPRPRAFDAAAPRILQLGTAPNKNVPRLVEALAGLPCRLVLVGTLDAPLHEALARAAVPYEHFDSLPRAAILAELERADVVAVASTYEGFGLPILEAQVTGRPVLAGDLPVLREVAGEGAAFAAPEDARALRAALDRIIGDPDFRAELVRKGATNARRFAPDAVAAQWLALYRELLADASVDA